MNTPKIEAKAATVAYGVAIMSKDEIKAGQDVIKTNLNGLDAMIHANAVQCLIHAEQHGDTSLMRRLLVEIVDAKSGYRRQGLIAWMRVHSPMELKGDTINLSGVKDGKKRPFLIAEAIKTPFTADNRFKEQVRPIFQSAITSKLDAGVREFKAAIANTKNGKPIDPTKPFYDGTNADKVVDLVEQIERIRAQMPEDHTREMRDAQRKLVESLGGDETKVEAVNKALSA